MTSLLKYAWRAGDPPEQLLRREWLVTNGLGGYASGTLLGVNTRRHHGLFVPNLSEPRGRHLLFSSLQEQLTCGDVVARCSGHEDGEGALRSDAHAHLVEFALEQDVATWRLRIGGASIEKRVFMVHDQNVVCVLYRCTASDEWPVRVQLRPYAAFRRHDAPLDVAGNRAFEVLARACRYELRLPDEHLAAHFALVGAPAAFVLQPHEERMSYRVERERGYDCSEVHHSPGQFLVELHAPAEFAFLASTQGAESLELDPQAVLAAERQRVERLLQAAPAAARDPLTARLVVSADQFIMRPAQRAQEELLAAATGSHVRSVIAGYHWFGDWGRDTMVSLEGLTLCTGRGPEAGAILRTFAGYVKDGLLPNLFPEGEREALYHTADATLWYFHAIDRYLQHTGDRQLLHDLYPVLVAIIEHHLAGTHYGIGVDAADGLLRAGAPGYQLTWMDAKAGDWVVTPRRGKPVEIQALWYNALKLMEGWSRERAASGTDHGALAARVRASFNARFWSERHGHLYDVVDAESGDENGADASGRPNQVFSISLEHPVLDEHRWPAVIGWIEQQLLTPCGLRTLVPGHPDYRRNYHGDLLTRDGAYHQGTVWPWLIGHFVDAWLKVHGGSADARARAARFLGAFEQHLSDFGMGSIAEIFDAEAPFEPRGCIAQAWSVAEVLRARLQTAPAALSPDAR